MDKDTRERHAKIEAHRIAADAIRKAVGGVASAAVLVDGQPDEAMRAAVLKQLGKQIALHTGQVNVFGQTFEKQAKRGKTISRVEIKTEGS